MTRASILSAKRGHKKGAVDNPEDVPHLNLIMTSDFQVC